MKLPISEFLRSQDGAYTVTFAIMLVPLVSAVGLVVDFSSGVTSRASMQNALDSATLSLVTMERDASDEERQEQLQAYYEASGGQGDAILAMVDFEDDGTLNISTTANFSMPTRFMPIVAINEVELDAATSVNKKPSLIEAEFEIVGASGWWNKTMTLYGRTPDDSDYEKLMLITYSYNGFGDPKGYGTTTIYTVDGKDWRGRDIKTQVQQQVCTTKKVSSFSGAPADAIKQTSGSNKYLTTCTTTSSSGSGAKIDVSEMSDLYLEMDVPSGSPSKLKSNDSSTSDRLYIDGVEVASGKVVDIFGAVPCGGTSTQAWEDGGNAVPAPVTNADFFYKVTGKCDFSQRLAGVSVTE